MNIEIHTTFTGLDGAAHHAVFDKYLMQPEEDEMWKEVSDFDRGIKTEVQPVVDLAYWHLLKEHFETEVCPDSLPAIPYKFDRKKHTATVQLGNGRLTVMTMMSRP